MALDYKQIKIILYTNLEGIKDGELVVHSKMLQHPGITDRKSFREYPSISFSAMYNFSALSDLNIQQRMDFFFNTNSHPLLSSIYPKIMTKRALNKEKQKKEVYLEQSNRIIKNNVECMLQLLLLASPLNSINVTGSLEIVTGKMQLPNLPSIYGFFNGISNTMLEIKGKNYSFDRVIWMNDVLNCPVYKNLFDYYIRFKNWLNDANNKVGVNSSSTGSENPQIEPLKNAIYVLNKNLEDNSTTLTSGDIFSLYKLKYLFYFLNPDEPVDTKQFDKFIEEIKADITKLTTEKGEAEKTKEEIRSNLQNRFTVTNSKEKKALTTKINNLLSVALKDSDFATSASAQEEFIKNLLETYSSKKIAPIDTQINEKAALIKISDSFAEDSTAKKVHKKAIISLAHFPLYTKDNMKEWLVSIDKFFNTNVSKLTDKTGMNEIIQALFAPSYDMLLDTFDIKSTSNQVAPFVQSFKKTAKDYMSFFSLSAQKNQTKSSMDKAVIEILMSIQKESFSSISSRLKALKIESFSGNQIASNINFAEYFKFFNSLREYKQRNTPANVSSNGLLQNLLNGEEDEDAERLFKFLDETYAYYYLDASNYDGNMYKFLYSGVNRAITSGNKETDEIYVLCDLYLGDEGRLYGEKNCNNKNENLGKKLESIISQGSQEGLEKKRQMWDVKYHRIMYSSAPEKAANQQNKNNPQKNEAPIANAAVDTNLFNQVVGELENESASNIKTGQPSADEEKHWTFDKSKTYMGNINKYDGGQSSQNNLLDILKGGDNEEKRLYSLFAEFCKNLTRFSSTLNASLMKQKSDFKVAIQIAQQTQDNTPGIINNPTEFNKLNLLCAKYTLYSKIIDKLITLESKKARNGGKKKYKTKKMRLSKKRFTRKNNYSRIN
jgi:hypothetical protein